MHDVSRLTLYMSQPGLILACVGGRTGGGKGVFMVRAELEMGHVQCLRLDCRANRVSNASELEAKNPIQAH